MSEKTATVRLTNAELNMVHHLVADHQREGDYWGNKQQHYARVARVLNKLMNAEADRG